MDIVVDLIRKCKNGDHSAYGELLARYESGLYAICYSYTCDREQSLDIIQEVYIKIFRSIKNFDESYPLLPWLKKITINTCLNHLRDNRKYKHLPMDGLAESDLSYLDLIESPDHIEEVVLQKKSRQIIMEALQVLPEIYRMALTLRYLEEMSYEEMARMLNLPMGTVKSHISRARRLLKQQLQNNHLLEV
jgi:RNA polymerase sigma-70 factor (ECF subfamily)